MLTPHEENAEPIPFQHRPRVSLWAWAITQEGLICQIVDFMRVDEKTERWVSILYRENENEERHWNGISVICRENILLPIQKNRDDWRETAKLRYMTWKLNNSLPAGQDTPRKRL